LVRRFRDLELHRALRLVLHHDRPGGDQVAVTGLLVWRLGAAALAPTRSSVGCPSLTLLDGLGSPELGGHAVGMSVNLTPQFAELVRAKVASGMYTSASEVVREALRLMDEQDRLRAAKLEKLRDDVREGLASGLSEPWNASKMKSDARMRRARKTT
jgi:antitoxin ParD1/3/4